MANDWADWNLWRTGGEGPGYFSSLYSTKGIWDPEENAWTGAGSAAASTDQGVTPFNWTESLENWYAAQLSDMPEWNRWLAGSYLYTRDPEQYAWAAEYMPTMSTAAQQQYERTMELLGTSAEDLAPWLRLLYTFGDRGALDDPGLSRLMSPTEWYGQSLDPRTFRHFMESGYIPGLTSLPSLDYYPAAAMWDLLQRQAGSMAGEEDTRLRDFLNTYLASGISGANWYQMAQNLF